MSLARSLNLASAQFRVCTRALQNVPSRKKTYAGERKVHNGRMPPPTHSWGKIANLYGRPLPRGCGWCAPCVCAHHALTPCRHPPHRGQRRRLRARAFGKGCINTGAMWCRFRNRFFLHARVGCKPRELRAQHPDACRMRSSLLPPSVLHVDRINCAQGHVQICTWQL